MFKRCFIFDCGLWRLASQLLYRVVYPFVLRLRHWAQPLMAVECLQNINPDLVFHGFSVHVGTRWFGLISAVFACRLTSFDGMGNALLGLLLLRKTTAWKSLPFATLLYDQTLSGFYWLVLVVNNHPFELVKLECFHEDFLLLLELELLLRIWIYKRVTCVSWHISRVGLVGRVENREPNCILCWRGPFNSMLRVSTDVKMVTRVHVDASIFEA
jgi:hypothetical protein